MIDFKKFDYEFDSNDEEEDNNFPTHNFLAQFVTRIEYDNNIEDNCAICLDAIEKPTLTACGHLFCYNCLKMCLDNKKLCPLCKTNITYDKLVKINNRK